MGRNLFLIKNLPGFLTDGFGTFCFPSLPELKTEKQKFLYFTGWGIIEVA